MSMSKYLLINIEKIMYVYLKKVYLFMSIYTGFYLFLEKITSTCIPIDVNILEINELIYQTVVHKFKLLFMCTFMICADETNLRTEVKCLSLL